MKQRASMVLPVPGEPTSKTLWPPAAAISSARLACACPQEAEGVSASSGPSPPPSCLAIRTSAIWNQDGCRAVVTPGRQIDSCLASLPSCVGRRGTTRFAMMT